VTSAGRLVDIRDARRWGRNQSGMAGARSRRGATPRSRPRLVAAATAVRAMRRSWPRSACTSSSSTACSSRSSGTLVVSHRMGQLLRAASIPSAAEIRRPRGIATPSRRRRPRPSARANGTCRIYARASRRAPGHGHDRDPKRISVAAVRGSATSHRPVCAMVQDLDSTTAHHQNPRHVTVEHVATPDATGTPTSRGAAAPPRRARTDDGD